MGSCSVMQGSCLACGAKVPMRDNLGRCCHGLSLHPRRDSHIWQPASSVCVSEDSKIVKGGRQGSP